MYIIFTFTHSVNTSSSVLPPLNFLAIFAITMSTFSCMLQLAMGWSTDYPNKPLCGPSPKQNKFNKYM